MRGTAEDPRRAPGYILHPAHLMPREPIRDMMDDGKLVEVSEQKRFFEETRKRNNPVIGYDYRQAEPQYSDKKDVATKITSREFIQMPTPEIVPPSGFRDSHKVV